MSKWAKFDISVMRVILYYATQRECPACEGLKSLTAGHTAMGRSPAKSFSVWKVVMPFVPASNTIKSTIVYAAGAGEQTNNMYWQINTTPDITILTAMANDFIDVWSELLDAVHPTTTQVVKVRMASQVSLGAPVAEVSPSAPLFGTGAGTPLPLNACMTITERTGIAGRAFRGRIYHSGAVQENLVTRKTFNPSACALITASYMDFMDAFKTAVGMDCELVVRHAFSGGIPLGSAVLTPVTNLLARTKVATLRKRVNL